MSRRVYSAMPFLRELRQLIDWWCSQSSLSLDDWMALDSMETDVFNCGAPDESEDSAASPQAVVRRFRLRDVASFAA